MLSNSCHDSCSTSIMIYNYTTCTAMIPIWKHIFSSQNRWKESEQSMKNIWTYNTLKTNHSGWVQLTEMGEWCIKICVLQTIFYNVAWYGVTLTKHSCLNAGTKTRAGALQLYHLYHAEMLTFVLCCIPTIVYDMIGIYRLQNIW